MKTEQQYVRAFAKAAQPIFAMKGWTYHDSDEPPSVERIEEVGTSLIDACRCTDSNGDYATTFASTGRITARRANYDGQITLTLELVSYYGDV